MGWFDFSETNMKMLNRNGEDYSLETCKRPNQSSYLKPYIHTYQKPAINHAYVCMYMKEKAYKGHRQ